MSQVTPIEAMSNFTLLTDACGLLRCSQYLRLRLRQGATHIDGRPIPDLLATNDRVIAMIRAEIERRDSKKGGST